MRTMDRRDALRRLASGGIGAAASALWVAQLGAFARQQALHVHTELAAAAQSAAPWTPRILDARQLETVAVLSELIIPRTTTPGARDTLVDRFIDSVLAEAPEPERTGFINGLAAIETRSQALFRSNFVAATAAQQTDLLTRLSVPDSREPRAAIDFFTAIKSMTITGYYTSEIGLRQELGDDGILAQGSFEGCRHQEHQE